jgi:hypothetical protein
MKFPHAAACHLGVHNPPLANTAHSPPFPCATTQVAKYCSDRANSAEDRITYIQQKYTQQVCQLGLRTGLHAAK